MASRTSSETDQILSDGQICKRFSTKVIIELTHSYLLAQTTTKQTNHDGLNIDTLSLVILHSGRLSMDNDSCELHMTRWYVK